MKTLKFVITVMLISACSGKSSEQMGRNNNVDGNITANVVKEEPIRPNVQSKIPELISSSEKPIEIASSLSPDTEQPVEGGVDVGNIHFANIPRAIAALNFPSNWSALYEGNTVIVSNQSGSSISARKLELSGVVAPSPEAVREYLARTQPDHDFEAVTFKGFEGVRSEITNSSDAKVSNLYLVSNLNEFIHIRSVLNKDDDGITEGDQIISDISLVGSFSRCVVIHEVWPRPADNRGPVSRLETLSFSVKGIANVQTFYSDRQCAKPYSNNDVTSDAKAAMDEFYSPLPSDFRSTDISEWLKRYEVYLKPKISMAKLFKDLSVTAASTGLIDILDYYGVLVVGYSTYKIEDDILKIARVCKENNGSFWSNHGEDDAWKYCQSGDRGLTPESRSADFENVPELKRDLIPVQTNFHSDNGTRETASPEDSSDKLVGRFSHCREMKSDDKIGPKGVMTTLDFSRADVIKRSDFFSDSHCKKIYSAEDAAADWRVYAVAKGLPAEAEDTNGRYTQYLEAYTTPALLTLGRWAPSSTGPLYFLNVQGNVIGFSSYQVENGILKIARICQALTRSPLYTSSSPAVDAWMRLNYGDSKANCTGDYGFSLATRSVDFTEVAEYTKQDN